MSWALAVRGQASGRVLIMLITAPSSAAIRGAAAMTTSTLATVVRVSANMKQVNITAHMTPDTRPGQPEARTSVIQRPRWVAASTQITKIAHTSERQNAIS